MKFIMKQRLVVWVFLSLICPALKAGTTCKPIKMTPQLYNQSSYTALSVQKKLTQSDAQVALLARVGTNLEKYGLRYSHVGFVIKDYPGAPGKWTVLHLLNECGTTSSSIYAQGLMNFFMDDLVSMDYQLVIPDLPTQRKLHALLLTDRVKQLHNKRYSLIAYPYSTRYQNSNQWVLEVLASALTNKPSPSRAAVQHYLLKTGYKPTVIKIDPFARLGASMFNSTVSFADHPVREQQTNQFSTVTVVSIVNYLKQQHLIQKIIN
ncbi:Uncharacterized protein conserved in bacteria [Legionella beliardensis]|uniref:Uncharacterized protein conserved in bacteria n=1 Tax=Legionella beliardensis TaxID=91822 RepID=A0A378HYF2_9GAMM|nr:DUF2145 domain-containing protein [Legionella beliardensis]STX27928.1 Uncharacterized protein conserved in bacteria [Legionella beliardensis]